MFNKSNFCHIASNNRNDQKGSVFIYKTSDSLSQVTQSGYFNEKLIDINVHDLIIHVQYDPVARTLKKSLLIVTERTMDNVETAPILDQTIGDDLADLGDQVAGIEEKIPSNASATNQLATESDITNKITNCLTEIPQDIKLELNNGTLTLNAGSKVYVPNGAGVFDVRNINSDTVLSTPSGTNQWLCAISATGTILTRPLSNCVSGAGATATTGFAYDTTANSIGFYNTSGVLQYSNISLPICTITTTDSVITSIDQVFNGFGYIGSTIFALPGVKGLVPNGRNEDGTLKSVLIQINSVITRTFNATGALYIGLQTTGFGGIIKSNYSYDPDTNIQYSSGTAFSNSIVFASCDMSSGVISNWTVLKNNPFRAFDYGDFLKYAFTVNEGTTLRNIQERFGDIINIKDFGAIGDGVTDDTSAFQAAIDSITATGNILLPAGNYIVTVANINLDGKTINYILTDDATISDNIPGAVFKSGKFTLPESSIQSTRDVRIHQYLDVGNSIAGQDNAKEYGFHVHGVIPEDGITTYTAQEFRAFSYDVESQKAYDEGSVYGIKGRVFGNGGSANLRSMYAFAEANNGFTGNLTGLLATVYVNGQSLNEAVALRAHCSDGATSGVEVAGAGSTLGGQMSFGYRIRTGTGQPGMPTVAAYAAHGGGTGDIFLGYKSNTELTVNSAPYRVTNKGVVKAQTHCTDNITIADDSVAIIDLGFNSYDGIIKFYVRQTLQTWGEVYYRVFGNAAATEIYSGSLVDITQNTVLTGTTGTDGHLTISATNDGKLYIENRLGAAKIFVYDIMAGLS